MKSKLRIRGFDVNALYKFTFDIDNDIDIDYPLHINAQQFHCFMTPIMGPLHPKIYKKMC